MILSSGSEIQGCVERIAQEIVTRHGSLDEVTLVGIRTGGAFLARRLQKALAALGFPLPPTGIIDITLYRDDWTRIAPSPIVGKTELNFSIEDKVVILVDDVLFTGRTVRAAMDALIDYGRPKRIELAVLVDRGPQYRELPITANYVGWVVETRPNETINVRLKEAGQEDEVVVEQNKAAA